MKMDIDQNIVSESELDETASMRMSENGINEEEGNRVILLKDKKFHF